MASMQAALLFIISLVVTSTQAHPLAEGTETLPILADLPTLERLGAPILAKDAEMSVGFTYAPPELQARISQYSHSVGRCGGFEVVPLPETGALDFKEIFGDLRKQYDRDRNSTLGPRRNLEVPKRESIEEALGQVDSKNIESWIGWLSSFKNRYNKAPTANVHVLELQSRVQEQLAASALPYEISLIEHRSTPQKSLRVRFVGKLRPQETVVLGGHLDSIASGWGEQVAPGADDNASGSASLLEAMRVLVASEQQPERSIEFMWYAGEESGLLGSAEIATSYKDQGRDVIAVLQLDMTGFAGDGEGIISNITDFTSPWLHQFLTAINQHYLQIQIVDDKCGYACSDHASWYRRGFSTLMPFEASTRRMNGRIHTSRDLPGILSYSHATQFSKIALIFALELGNSTLRSQ